MPMCPCTLLRTFWRSSDFRETRPLAEINQANEQASKAQPSWMQLLPPSEAVLPATRAASLLRKRRVQFLSLLVVRRADPSGRRGGGVVSSRFLPGLRCPRTPSFLAAPKRSWPDRRASNLRRCTGVACSVCISRGISARDLYWTNTAALCRQQCSREAAPATPWSPMPSALLHGLVVARDCCKLTPADGRLR